MKKKFVAILSVFIAFACLMATGCAGVQTLTFKNNFVGGVEHSAVPASYVEKLTYDVDYTSAYHTDYIVKSKNITDDKLKFTFGKGSLVQEFTILNRFPLENVNTNVTGDKIYHVKSSFTIPVTYSVNGGQDQSFTDTVTSEVYFLAADLSFAPIYSKTESSNTYVNVTNDNPVTLYNVKMKSNAVYNKENYVLTIQTNDEQPTTNTYTYTYRTAIDNAQLFFAIRNLSLSADMYSTLPTVSTTFGAVKDLHVRLHGDMTDDFNVNYNENGIQTTESGNVKFNHVSFILGTTTNTGSAQYLKIQKEATTNLPYRALVLEYAETLTTYGSPQCMGALVYTLKSVEITK